LIQADEVSAAWITRDPSGVFRRAVIQLVKRSLNDWAEGKKAKKDRSSEDA
jgi:hypothetical protein